MELEVNIMCPNYCVFAPTHIIQTEQRWRRTCLLSCVAYMDEEIVQIIFPVSQVVLLPNSGEGITLTSPQSRRCAIQSESIIIHFFPVSHAKQFDPVVTYYINPLLVAKIVII